MWLRMWQSAGQEYLVFKEPKPDTRRYAETADYRTESSPFIYSFFHQLIN
jgi:hypothetical protein